MNPYPRLITMSVLLAIAVFCAPATPTFAGNSIDYLRKVSLPADQIEGTWEKTKDGGYESDSTAPAKLRLPTPREGDYSIRVKFTRLEGDGPVGVVLVRGGHAFAFLLGGDKEDGSEGFTLLGNKSTGQNALKKESHRIAINNRKPVSVVIKVLEKSVSAVSGNKKIAVHETDYSDLALDDAYQIDGGHLGLFTYNAATVFHEVKFAPIIKPAPKERVVVNPKKNQPSDNVDSIDPFRQGNAWTGNYNDSLNGNSSCGMHIAKRNGNRVHAVIHYGHDRAMRLVFDINKGKIRVVSANDVSRFGNRQMTGVQIAASPDSFQIRCVYILNSERRKNQPVEAQFDMSKES